MVSRARMLVPTIADYAEQAEADREIHPEIVARISEAGLFRLYQPKRFGGYELPYGCLQLQISSLIGAACGSTAWTQSVLAIHSWMLGGFPLAAQEAAWGHNNGDALISSSGACSESNVERRSDGIVIGGRWHFSSGCHHCDFIVLRVPLGAAGDRANACWCLIKKSDVKVIDVWHPTGLRGTGSNDLLIDALFVPAEHTVDALSFRGDECSSQTPFDSHLFRLPYGGVFPFSVAAPALGMARGALAHVQREGIRRPPNPTRQIRFSEASVLIDSAELLLRENAKAFEVILANRGVLDSQGRATAKRNAAFGARLCLRGVSNVSLRISVRVD